MSEKSSKFLGKISPLIEGQFPDFVRDENKLFVKFVQDYYKFLEAGKMELTAAVDYVKYETETLSYILNDDGDRIVAEQGAGTVGNFVNGETVVGSISNATAEVLVEDVRNGTIYISSNQKFETGETITGQTSTSTGVLKRYRANPVQNIQQLLDYADVDNTIFDFLNKFRDSFMEAIPNTLATGTAKRNLIKSIRDLYTAKGTSEGHKLFMRLLLGESASIFYPTKYMLRVSNGDWRQKTTMRVETIGSSADEIVNQVITGATSFATAIVVDTITFQQGSVSVTELEIDSVNGEFNSGELITAISTLTDVPANFRVRAIVSQSNLDEPGALYVDNETIDAEALGNNFADIRVSGIESGGITDIDIDGVGLNYQVGDIVTFIANSVDTNVSAATGFVSVVGGGITDEDGTGDIIILEGATDVSSENFNIQLESRLEDRLIGDGTTRVFTLVNVPNTDTITIYIDNVITTAYLQSNSTITFTTAPKSLSTIFIKGNAQDFLLLNGTNGSSLDAGYKLQTNQQIEVNDTFGTVGDQLVLEDGSFPANEFGQVKKIFIENSGDGYTRLPTISVTSTFGTNADITAISTEIGKIQSIKISDSGFNYDADNAPTIAPRAHFILKDVSGTFALGNTLSTNGHTGVVQSYDSSTKLLTTTFENEERITHEQDGTFNNSIELEGNTADNLSSQLFLEDEQEFDGGDNIVLDGTAIREPVNQTFVLKVKKYAELDEDGLSVNRFMINESKRPDLALYEGNTYYFDLSDPSLYTDNTSVNAHQLRFSTTPNGTHNSGSAFTNGVTESVITLVPIGTVGAFIQIVVPFGAPNLYYYCTNHSGMGNSILTPQLQSVVLDVGSNILTDGLSKHEFNILLEDAVNFTGFGIIEFEEDPGFTQGRLDLEDKTKLLLEDSSEVSGGVIELEDSNGKIVNGYNYNVGGVQLEESISSFVQGIGDKIVMNKYREINPGSVFIVQEENGDKIHGEDFGFSLTLEDNDLFLLDDETADFIVLDASNSGALNTGQNLILEQPIDFSGKDVVITDSGGATGTIIFADIATGTTEVNTISTGVGNYVTIDNLIGEDLIRIQDSFYYQDFSYEVAVGQSTATYINQLKRAVHPAGFAPFGKVSIASFVSATVGTTAAGVAGYLGDTQTFTPELASVLEVLFDQTIQRRLVAGSMIIGNRDDQVLLENGIPDSAQMALEGSSATVASGMPANISLLLEDSLQPTNYDYAVSHIVQEDNFQILHETGRITDEFDSILMEDGSTILMEIGSLAAGKALLYEGNQIRDNEAAGGRVMSESSSSMSGKAERTLTKEMRITRATKPINHAAKNLLTYLYDHPFAVEEAYGGIQLQDTFVLGIESGTMTEGDGDEVIDNLLQETGGLTLVDLEQSHRQDVIRLDGEEPLPSVAFLNMENGDHIQQEQFEVGSSDEGIGRTMLEVSIFTFIADQVRNRNEKLLLSEPTNDDTLTLSELGDIQITEIARKGKILQDGFGLNGQSISTEDTGIALEEDGFILMDGNEISGVGDAAFAVNENSSILLENITGKHERIIQETAGAIVEEDSSTLSIIDVIQLEDALDDGIGVPSALLIEATYLRAVEDIIVQEDGTTADGGNIVLDATSTAADGNPVDENERLLQEQDTADIGSDRINHIVLETSAYISNRGVKPIENYTMSGSINTSIRNIPIVQPAIITLKVS